MVESQSNQQVGYILRSYPRLSQTFIVNEILALEQAGVPIQIFAIVDPQEPVVQPQSSKVRAQVHYLSSPRRQTFLSILLDHLWAILMLGPKYFQSLFYVFWRKEIDLGYTAANRMACFRQAIALVRFMDQDRRKNKKTISYLHAHFAHDPSLIAQLVHRMTRVPYGFTAHARDLYQVREEVLRERIRDANLVVTCCHTNLEYLERISPSNRDKFSLVYHGVDLSGFRPAATKKQKSGLPLLLSVGRLVEKKGFFDLLLVLQKVKSQGAAFRCEIYGDGPLQPLMQQWIDEHGMAEEIVLAGSRTQEELIPIYQRADLFLLTPIITEDGDRDGIPNVFVEAMAVGLPVISTSVAGIPEVIIHDHNGLLYPPHDIDGLAAGVMDLLQDESKRRQLGEAALITAVEKLDVNQAASKLRDVFVQASRTQLANASDSWVSQPAYSENR